MAQKGASRSQGVEVPGGHLAGGSRAVERSRTEAGPGGGRCVQAGIGGVGASAGERQTPWPVDGALSSPLSGRTARWLAFVPRAFSVIAQLRGADQRGVRVGFRDEPAAARRPAAAVGISPARQCCRAQQLNAGQPRRMDVRRISAYLPPATPLPDLGLAETLTPSRCRPRAARQRT